MTSYVTIALIAIACIGEVFGVLSLVSYLRISRGFCELGRIFRCEEVYFVPEKYSKPFGIHFSVWAPLYFAVMTTLSVLSLAFDFTKYLMALCCILGLLLIPYLVYIEVRIAKSLCLYCTIMHALIIIYSVLFFTQYTLP